MQSLAFEHTLVTFLIPIVALVLGNLVLGERIGWLALLGLVFILLGLAVAQGRIFARRGAMVVEQVG